MKHIKLTKGKFAIVDDDMYEYLNQWKWCIKKGGCTYYAVRAMIIDDKQTTLYMHRQILGLKKGDGKNVDHINGDGLFNIRKNIRLCTHSQNAQNIHKIRDGKSSQYRGVCWDKSTKKWMAYIMKNFKQTTIGQYKNELKAAKMRDNEAKELFGQFANTNF